MNLNQLRFVKATALEASFSKAAQNCHVTQPTLSNGVALLEEEFGAKIFDRTTRKVSLTPFGGHILPLVDAVLEARGELEAGVKTYFNPAHKLLRIGLSPIIDPRLLKQVLEPYQSDFPDADIFFKECFLDDMGERLQNGQIDIMLCPHLSGESMPRNVVRSTFYEEDLYYLPKEASSSPVVPGGKVMLKAVAGEVFILSYDGCGLASAIRDFFADAGHRLHEYSGQTLSYQVLQEWADLGIGATILPFSRISSEFKDKALQLMITPKKPARIKIEAYWLKGAHCPQHIVAMHRHIHERVPQLIAGSMGH